MDILLNGGRLGTEDLIPLIVHHLFDVPGMILNAILLVFVYFLTPHWLRTYSVLIANTALTDLLNCAVNLIVMQRSIPIHSSLFYISYGYCTLAGPRACYLGYCVQLHLIAHGVYSLCLSFAYRYYVLKNQGSPPRNYIILICIITYLPSSFQMISFTWADDPVEEVRKDLIRQLHYNLTNLTVTGHLSVFETWTLFTILYMVLPAAPVYCFIYWCRKRVHACLSVMDMSSKTKKIHKELIMALTLQSVPPFIFAFCVGAYSVQQLNLCHSPFLEHVIFGAAALIPLLSPIFSIYFVRPYRIAFGNMMRPGKQLWQQITIPISRYPEPSLTGVSLIKEKSNT